MTIFKGYLKGAVRQRTVIFLYLIIFLGLGTLMTLSMDENNTDLYTSQQLTMTVIDRDHSALSKGLKQYLGESQELIELDDEEDVLKEELYYGNIQYVLIIPEGFQEEFQTQMEAEEPEEGTFLEGTGRPGSTQDHYAKELADTYLTGAGLYLRAGFSPEETVEHMKNLEGGEGRTVLQEGSTSMSKIAGTLQYLPFVLIALSCYVIGFVMLDYQRLEIRRRLAVSAVSPWKRTAQMVLSMLVVGMVFFFVSILMTALMNAGTILDEPNKLWYLGNMGSMVLVGLSIAFLVVHVAGSGNGVNGLANVIALGMSFICGVFIPDSMLSASVRRIAKFLPVYWYEQNNMILGTHGELSTSMIERLTEGYGKQLFFAAVIFAAALLVSKGKDRAKKK